MKLKLFTFFLLAAMFVSSSGTVLPQGPLPPISTPASTPKNASLLASNAGKLENGYISKGNVAALAASFTNGNFEQGAVGWSQSSSNGYQLILKNTNLPIPPHGGSWAVWLGGAPNEQSVLSQPGILIDRPISTVWFWRHQGEDAGGPPRRHPHGHPAGLEPQGHRGHPEKRAEGDPFSFRRPE